MKKKKIWDYFNDNIEYPKNIADNPIPYGEVWTYVSSTFLNGFINYAKPVACYVVNRYTLENEDISDRNVSICDKGEFGKWHEFSGTKKEFIELIVSGKKEMYHTSISCFSDDIIILARIEEDYKNEKGMNKFIFFWFDMDVSDCSIGRFKTQHCERQVIESVENWLEEEFNKNRNHESDHVEAEAGFYRLPVEFLKGWIKF